MKATPRKSRSCASTRAKVIRVSGEKSDRAYARYIEQNDVVVQAAKIINPDAFGPPWVNTDTGEELGKAKRAYRQSEALSKASQILQLAAKHKQLRETLIASELDFWDMLGLPARTPEFEEIVREKYAPE